MPEQSEMADQEIVAEAEGTEIQFLFPESEEKILNATIKAFESGSLTPLIKEELRCTIQSRRLAAGKGELTLEEFKKPPKKKPMTDDEKKRAHTRRLQNREAAQRFRQRQKDQACYLSDKIHRLEKTSSNLINDLQRLKDERDELKQMLQDHLVVCTNSVHISEAVCPDIEHFIQQCTNQQNNLMGASVTPSQHRNTDDSVFFPDEITCIQNEHLVYGNFLESVDTNYIQIINDNCSLMNNLMEVPEMGQEMVVSGIDLSDSVSEYSDDQRLESCSSVETVSNYSSVSSDYSLDHSNCEVGSSLSSTFSLVPFCSSYLQTAYTTNDIILVDESAT